MTRFAFVLPCATVDEVHAACPDLVDQGLGSVDALAEDMRRHQTLSLWWD